MFILLTIIFCIITYKFFSKWIWMILPFAIIFDLGLWFVHNWVFTFFMIAVIFVIYGSYLNNKKKEKEKSDNRINISETSKVRNIHQKKEETPSYENTVNEEKLKQARETLEKYNDGYKTEKEIAPGIISSISAISSAPTVKSKSPYTIHRLRRKLYDYVVLDIETTGLDKKDNDIIQISALKFLKDKCVKKFNTYVKPDRDFPLPEKIKEITGITDEDVSNAPDLKDVMPAFKEFIDGFPLVGHNIISFDIPFLFNHGLEITDYKVLDTLNLSRNKLPMIKNHKLPTLKKYYGIDNQSHNSLSDCETNAIVYQKLREIE